MSKEEMAIQTIVPGWETWTSKSGVDTQAYYNGEQLRMTSLAVGPNCNGDGYCAYWIGHGSYFGVERPEIGMIVDGTHNGDLDKLMLVAIYMADHVYLIGDDDI